MATAKQAVTESLLGTTREPELSQQTKATFDRNARQDEVTDDYYMTEEDFVNAIAPASENYVSSRPRLAPFKNCLRKRPSADLVSVAAQNKKGAIRYLVPDRGSKEDWTNNFARLGELRESTCQTGR